MNFSQYYKAIQEKLKQHNLLCMKCVAQEFYERDYSVDEVVAEFNKIIAPKPPVITVKEAYEKAVAEPQIITVKDYKRSSNPI